MELAGILLIREQGQQLRLGNYHKQELLCICTFDIL